MKVLILPLVFTFLFSFQDAFSQIDKNVLIKSKGKFYYQNKIYKKKELGKLFVLDKASFNYYQKHKKAKKIFNISGISTLVLAAGGSILFSIDGGGNHSEGDKCYELCPHQGLGIYMMIGSWFTTAPSIISLAISRKNYKKSIKSFHNYTESIPELGNNRPELNFNYTGNGVGLVLNF